MRSFSIGKPQTEPVIEAEPIAPHDVRHKHPRSTAVRIPDRETIICDDIQIRGDLTSRENLLIEGAIEGEVRGGEIEIGEKGRVIGSIVAESLTVRGRVQGTITATTVQLAKTAIVEGDILHQGIGIEMGTHYDGRLKWNGDPSLAANGTTRTVEALKQAAQNGATPVQQHVDPNAEATNPRQ